jgi:hypothetical protein
VSESNYASALFGSLCKYVALSYALIRNVQSFIRFDRLLLEVMTVSHIVQ